MCVIYRIFLEVSYDLINPVGHCKHKDGGELTSCDAIKSLNSENDCEALCTAYGSCLGYNYVAILNKKFCHLYGPFVTCPEDLFINKQKMAMNRNDVVKGGDDGCADSVFTCKCYVKYFA